MLRDIGRGGAFVKTEEALPSASDVVLIVSPPGAEVAMPLSARVCWKGHPGGQNGFGVEWKARDAGGTRRIKELVRRIEAQGTQLSPERKPPRTERAPLGSSDGGGGVGCLTAARRVGIFGRERSERPPKLPSGRHPTPPLPQSEPPLRSGRLLPDSDKPAARKEDTTGGSGAEACPRARRGLGAPSP